MRAAEGDAAAKVDAAAKMDAVRTAVLGAKAASRVLGTLSAAQRNGALEAMAAALSDATSALLAANVEDLRTAAALTGAEALLPATLSRLTLDEDKVQEMVAQLRSVAALPDPLGRVLDALELDDREPGRSDGLPAGQERFPAEMTTDATNAAEAGARRGLYLQKISVPLGVLAVIFEARPDAVTQIAALALKSGNAVLLKPGREVERTAAALVHVLRGVLRERELPMDAIVLVPGREQAHALLAMHHLIDMVIPRGSKALVEYVQANTRIPVLGHAEGVCHIYVDRAADPALALRVIADAKLDYAAACNAVETVLVHREMASMLVPRLIENLQAKGVQLRGDARVQSIAASVKAAQVEPVGDWHTEFGGPVLAVGVVDSLDAALEHIHLYGSAHTESILTEDVATAERFLREVDAAGVFHNASTRFADGFRYGFGAEVGVSTSKFHARGPVGLDGLTTYKYLLRGQGHVAGDYRGSGARAFTHRR